MTVQPRNGRIASGVLSGQNGVLIYTVPANEVLLLKQAWLWLWSGGPSTFFLRCETPAGAQMSLLSQANVANDTVAKFDGWIALNAGDTIHCWISPGQGSYWLSGALLNGPFPPVATAGLVDGPGAPPRDIGPTLEIPEIPRFPVA